MKKKNFFFPTEGNEKTGSLLVTKLFGSFSKRGGFRLKKLLVRVFIFIPSGSLYRMGKNPIVTDLQCCLVYYSGTPLCLFFLPSNKTFFLSLCLIVSNQLGRTVRQKLPRLSELQTCKHVISSVGELSRFGSNGSRTEDGDCF